MSGNDMDDDEMQVTKFERDLELLIERYRLEFDLTYAQVIGALVIKTHILCNEASEDI